MTTSWSRRQFLRSLGISAASPFVTPLGLSLARSAWGAPAVNTSKNVVFISLGGGLPDLQLGWPSRQPAAANDGGKAISFTQWSYHEALAPLEPWRANTVIVRNLSLGLGAMQHSGGYGLLAGGGLGDGETPVGNEPWGQTIDQLLAGHLGDDVPFRSLLFGIEQDAKKTMHQSLFARGPGQPVSYPVQASRLFDTLFPAASADRQHAAVDRRVLVRTSAELERVRRALVGNERAQLDGYLASLEA